jgi:hypothetical protein
MMDEGGKGGGEAGRRKTMIDSISYFKKSRGGFMICLQRPFIIPKNCLCSIYVVLNNIEI